MLRTNERHYELWCDFYGKIQLCQSRGWLGSVGKEPHLPGMGLSRQALHCSLRSALCKLDVGFLLSESPNQLRQVDSYTRTLVFSLTLGVMLVFA